MSEDAYVFTDLPIDCIVNICQFLPLNDVINFSKVCKFFYQSSLVGSIWRRYSLSRWPFCDVAQISAGPGRWRRYYIARRSVEHHFDKGRPNEDYKAKTLRGHESPITMVLAMTDVIDWDNPRPPMVISLCSAGKVKCWDAVKGTVAWSMDNELVTAIAADNITCQIALASNESVVIRSPYDFKSLNTLSSISGGTLSALQYIHLNGTLPTILLMGYIPRVHPQSSWIIIWNPNGSTKPLIQLDAPPYKGMLPVSNEIFYVSKSRLLAINSTGTITVWDLRLLVPQESPVAPHATVHCDTKLICWLYDNCLATYTLQKIDIWDVTTTINVTQRQTFRYNEGNIYTPLRSIIIASTLTCLCPSTQFLLAGDSSGNVHVFDPTKGNCLQTFCKPPHNGTVTDICGDGTRVVSCSSDFSIRVYRWTADSKLESLYTLLGGSVAHKTHNGFWKVILMPNSCLGICGNQVKVYTFAAKLTLIIGKST